MINPKTIAVAAIAAAVTVGGAANAGAQTPSHHARAHAKRVAHHTGRPHRAHGARTASLEPGAVEQQAPEAPGAAEMPGVSDGPGGHQDGPGNASTDHQFDGEE